jgi:thiosulfate/3-mercaptopyruvate sulfurtransferase
MKNSSLISADDLLEKLNKPNIKLFDIRGVWGTSPASIVDDYHQGHIPGACYLDWTTHFIDSSFPIDEAPVALIENVKRSFEELGISEGDEVILYDDFNHMFASRLWWAIRYWGFFNVKILDGGWSNWIAKSLPVSVNTDVPSRGSFLPKKQQHLRVSTSQLTKIFNERLLIDARNENSFKGSLSDSRSGHIPSAINISFKTLLDENSGLFKSSDELIQIFDEKLGTWRDKKIISSCASGYAGAVVLFAIELLGYEAALYDDSFTIWKKELQRPIEQG